LCPPTLDQATSAVSAREVGVGEGAGAAARSASIVVGRLAAAWGRGRGEGVGSALPRAPRRPTSPPMRASGRPPPLLFLSLTCARRSAAAASTLFMAVCVLAWRARETADSPRRSLKVEGGCGGGRRSAGGARSCLVLVRVALVRQARRRPRRAANAAALPPPSLFLPRSHRRSARTARLTLERKPLAMVWEAGAAGLATGSDGR